MYINIYFKIFQVIIMSIILNLHNDPCFEDKSLSLTLKYRPVHFSDKAVADLTCLFFNRVFTLYII